MTRLTNDLRNDIFRKIMKGLPNRDFQIEIFNLVQQVVRDFMPPKLQAVYDDPKLRELLAGSNLRLSYGSDTRYVYGKETDNWRSRVCVVGLANDLNIRISDAENDLLRGKADTMYQHLLFKTELVQLYRGWVEQEQLRKQVEKRLKANLAAATTLKKLYDILEPELHSFIPREAAADKTLPATVAPVVDDLKKLGLVVADVPKATA